MSDRRFLSGGLRRGSPSPRRVIRSREFDSPRNRNYSSDARRGAVEYSRVGGRSQRLERTTDRHSGDFEFDARGRRDYDDDRDRGRGRGRHRYIVGDRRSKSPARDQYHGDFDARARREYVDRDRGRERDSSRYPFGGRRSRSPLNIEKKDDLDRGIGLRSDRLLGYDERGKHRNSAGVDVGLSRRSYDDDSHRRERMETLLDKYNTRDSTSVRDYEYAGKYSGAGETRMTREVDYLRSDGHLDSSHGGPLSGSQYMDSIKPVSMEYETGGSIHPHSHTLNIGPVDDIHISKLIAARGGMSSASQYHSSVTGDQGHFHLEDESHLGDKRDGTYRDREHHYFEKKYGDVHLHDELLGIEKKKGKGINKDRNEENFHPSRGYSKEDDNYIRSSSQPKDFASASLSMMREDFPSYSGSRDNYMTSDSIQTGRYLTSEPVGFASEKKQMMSPREGGLRLDDIKGRSRIYLGLPMEKDVDQLHPEYGRHRVDRENLMPNTAKDDYRYQYSSKAYVSEPLFDEFPDKRYAQDGSQEKYPYSEARLTPDKVDEYDSLHARTRDLEIPGARNSYHNNDIEGYSGYKNVEAGDHHHDRMHGDRWFGGERYDILRSREYVPSTSRFYDSPRKKFDSADRNLAESSGRWLSSKRVRHQMPYNYDGGIQISMDENGVRKIYNQILPGDEYDLRGPSKNPKRNDANDEKTWGSSIDMTNYLPSSSQCISRHTTDPCKSNPRDIKKRLGPQKLHVSQRLSKKYKPSALKRLAPAPSKKRANPPWLKPTSTRKSGIRNNVDGIRDTHNDGNQSGGCVTLAKPEPREGSEDFRQLVQSSFFKFLKQINETPMKRKKHAQGGKTGSLKCSVCGSMSEEYADTKDLAKHAFTSEKSGVRSQHLGLNKALCALMGWKIVEEPSSDWHCELLSDSDISAMRDDIVIWPPVVIVHNNNISSSNPDEQVTISSEELETKLKGMGFASILKVCNGKPANQSVMVVKFNGTLSGLQEAMRLHKTYAESKNGRAEFEQLKTKKGSDVGEYGYLGITEDLDKLDSDTKKRCVLKSKKEILSIADAPLDVK